MKTKQLFTRFSKIVLVILLIFASSNVVRAQDLLVEAFCSHSKTVQYRDIKYKINIYAKTADVMGLLDSLQTEVVIPDKIEYEGVTYTIVSIVDNSFMFCVNLKTIKIPDTVNYIGKKAFLFCRNLKMINLPNAIISGSAFEGCSSLTKITIPKSTTRIEPFTFLGCTALTKIDIPNTVTYIGDFAFWNCKKLKRLEIPNMVDTIGRKAFEMCVKLKKVTILNPNIVIEEDAFKGTKVNL